MSAKIEYKQKEIRVYLSGEIDHHSASLIRASIDDAIIHKKPSMLVMDFGEVSFMDSSGIAVVMRAQRRMQELGGSAAVVDVSPQARRVLHTAGIDRWIRIK